MLKSSFFSDLNQRNGLKAMKFNLIFVGMNLSEKMHEFGLGSLPKGKYH